MLLKGKTWKFGDSISTDLICPGRYYHLRSNLAELAKYVLEDARKEFARSVNKGDFIVGGANFGLGSSREHAPLIIKLAGVSAILVKSAARIFYRNAINIGLPVIILNTEKIKEGDILELDLEKGGVKDITTGEIFNFSPFPSIMARILQAGGLIPYLERYKDLKV